LAKSIREARDKTLFVQHAMAHRKANPPTIDWCNALNLIDVAFASHPEVLRKWHEFYGVLHTPSQINTQAHQHTYLNMLSEMANVLGYRKLQQTDIDKFYTPQIYATQAAANAELQTQMMEFLKNLNQLVTQRQLPGLTAEPTKAAPSPIMPPPGNKA
jgi:hypothetical protein